MKEENATFGWKSLDPTCAHNYILPTIIKQVQAHSRGNSIRIYDIGCGNGFVASQLAKLGHSVVAVDASPDGIEMARLSYPDVDFMICSIYDERLVEIVGGPGDCVVALDVVEHLFHPKILFEQSRKLLKNGGRLIISTPYHGYLKNLAISIVNGWDRHFSVEWHGGHVKFFSKATLSRMASNAGFANLRFYGVGRLPWLWKSMILIAEI